MPELTSRDGRYLLADQGDGNVVVYDLQRGIPVWAKSTYEAGLHADVDGGTGGGGAGPTLPEPPVPPPSTSPRLIRVTDEQDGALLNRGYSYWSQAWVDGGTVVVFVGHADGRPRFFRVHLMSGAIQRLGSLLPYGGTGEGIYWDQSGWLYVPDGPRLTRFNPFTREEYVVFDISDTHPGCRLWQAHSSDDGQTHSATVQRIVEDGPYPNIGTVVYWLGDQEYFPARGALDESAITPDGAYLVIKEDDGNRIFTLGTRETRVLTNAAGAVGHSDCGPGFVVGEDDQHGACVLWDLRQPLTPDRRRELLKTWGMGHVSVRGGRCLRASVDNLSLIALDGSGETILCPHGMVSDGTYDTQVFASLDPTGRVACWLSNVAGRMDLYVLPFLESRS